MFPSVMLVARSWIVGGGGLNVTYLTGNCRHQSTILMGFTERKLIYIIGRASEVSKYIYTAVKLLQNFMKIDFNCPTQLKVDSQSKVTNTILLCRAEKMPL